MCVLILSPEGSTRAGKSLSFFPVFPSTRHSAVLGARSADPQERERAWSALVAAYWKPAYQHLRVKWKAGPEQAEDAVQAFFERAVQKDFFSDYAPERARFRTFFKTCLDRHQANEAKAAQRIKRGGPAGALDFKQAELELEKAGAAAWEAPEEVFDREWKRQLFTRGVQALEREARAADKAAAFEAFRRYDLSEPPRPKYDEVARELGVPVTTVTNHLSWARQRLRALVLEELAAVTATERELREEAAAAGVG